MLQNSRPTPFKSAKLRSHGFIGKICKREIWYIQDTHSQFFPSGRDKRHIFQVGAGHGSQSAGRGEMGELSVTRYFQTNFYVLLMSFFVFVSKLNWNLIPVMFLVRKVFLWRKFFCIPFIGYRHFTPDLPKQDFSMLTGRGSTRFFQGRAGRAELKILQGWQPRVALFFGVCKY